MDRTVETWIVVADGCGVQVFEEARRLGPLRERSDLAAVSHEDRKAAAAQAAPGAGRFGDGRHDGARSAPAAAERRFLEGVARDVHKAALAGRFRRLVLMAPPTALGVLRCALAAATLRRVEVCDPHERRGEGPAALRARLQVLRSAS